MYFENGRELLEIAIEEDDLKKIKEYEGELFKEGLWEAMQIDNQMSIENYGIDILGDLKTT